MNLIKRRLLKPLARTRVYFRTHSLSYEARISVIRYSMQELENPFN